MKSQKYSIGLDYGTESGRAVLVDIHTGEEIATHVTPYKNGVIEEGLPESNIKLEQHYALQDPEDYLDVLAKSVPEVIRLSGVHPDDIIGIGVDFTSCTVVPVNEQLMPLCKDSKWKNDPHAWVKLWKHHAAQDEADKMTLLASQRNEEWLKRYGGKISSEWLVPKIWQVLDEAPDVFEATDLYLEAGDWVIAQMTGEVKRNSCAAGYKGTWHKSDGHLSTDFLKALHPKLGNLYQTKLRGEVVSLGSKAGELSEEFAQLMNLNPGTAVAVGIIDAHAGVPGVGVAEPGKMVMVMGTSTCHMLLSDKEVLVEGISGVVEDGIIPGLFAYEAGQAAVGDIFAWFVKHNVPRYIEVEAENLGISVHELLEQKANKLLPGQSGLLALDWHNGNRTPLVDTSLSGMILGQTLSTKPEEVYRALIEATAFGSRLIIDTFRDQGVEVNELYACGGLPHRNKLLMQIYADVTNIEIKVSATTLTPSIGSAMYGAVAAGVERGGYTSVIEAASKMARLKEETFKPNPSNVKVYEELYKEYVALYKHFGRETNSTMRRIKELKDKISKKTYQMI
ncbi:ribulokinase [Halalkalibacter okhensis]|uniref:Ribulokinase n=1 Tax=Halalkalibacter okhensis TaxID=333138 RepID=A0A0B0IL88_9BACI|nr:ribulokinase [Halalkalibacter okhensis]KHF41662.1 ribulokinase [Halalkalibacter okhensis]